MRAILFSILLVLTFTTLAAAAPPAGYTQMTFSPGHGTQVEYLAKDGRTFLWYPGNTVVLAGEWKTEGADICFRYGGNTYNPVTKHRGGGWECTPLKIHTSVVVEQKKGDVFGLAGRKQVPFDLSPKRMNMAQLVAIAAGPAVHTGDPQTQCDAVIANMNSSRAAKIEAALLYYHGMRMGQKCVKVDYVRAFALLREAGDGRNFASLLRDLQAKAAAGNPRAVAALKKIDVSPVTP